VEYDEFIGEIELRMTEETDYKLELKRSRELSSKCKHIPNLVFPEYYSEYSSEKILTMDWIEGKPLGDVALDKLPAGEGTKLGQAMWDFYHYQMYKLKSVHADPHPGNFLMRDDGTVGVFDFGCIKEIPEDFYVNYFLLTNREVLKDEARRREIYTQLEMIHPTDTEKEITFFSELFQKMIDMLTLPFRREEFDFGDETYFNEIYGYMDYLYNLKEVRESKVARGSRHSLYVNRTYFGLYSILSDLKAKVITSEARIQKLMVAATDSSTPKTRPSA